MCEAAFISKCKEPMRSGEKSGCAVAAALFLGSSFALSTQILI